LTPEKQVENAILEYLRMRGLFCFKLNTVGIYDASKKIFRKSNNKFVINGVSDIIGILPNGRFLAIEVKTDNTKTSKKTYPTDNQKFFLANIASNGGLAFVARSVDDVKAEFTKIRVDEELKAVQFPTGLLK
jgi:hypothetical protein